jgi:hypothetical protein
MGTFFVFFLTAILCAFEMTLLNVEINLDKKNVFLIYCRVGKVRTFFGVFWLVEFFFSFRFELRWLFSNPKSSIGP